MPSAPSARSARSAARSDPPARWRQMWADATPRIERHLCPTCGCRHVRHILLAFEEIPEDLPTVSAVYPLKCADFQILADRQVRHARVAAATRTGIEARGQRRPVVGLTEGESLEFATGATPDGAKSPAVAPGLLRAIAKPRSATRFIRTPRSRMPTASSGGEAATVNASASFDLKCSRRTQCIQPAFVGICPTSSSSRRGTTSRDIGSHRNIPGPWSSATADTI